MHFDADRMVWEPIFPVSDLIAFMVEKEIFTGTQIHLPYFDYLALPQCSVIEGLSLQV